MIKYLFKASPLIQWLKWVGRTLALHKQYPSLSIGYRADIASNCKFGIGNLVSQDAKLYDVSMGNYSYVGKRSELQYTNIGEFCSIAPDVIVGTGIHPTHLSSTHPAFYSKQSSWKKYIRPDLSLNIKEYERINIGDDVWIGTRAIILDGVRIGSHAVIAAGAVVTKDVPEYAIMGGVPAKIIKYRNIVKNE